MSCGSANDLEFLIVIGSGLLPARRSKSRPYPFGDRHLLLARKPLYFACFPFLQNHLQSFTHMRSIDTSYI